jgi:hypothetical protein
MDVAQHKRQVRDFMQDHLKTQEAEKKAFDDMVEAETDDLADKAASFAYRDTVGGAGRRGRTFHSLRAPFLPLIINGKRVWE